MTSTRPRAYCIVYGCLNSSNSNPELSFFTLPTDVERRSKWLSIISREDLRNKIPHNYSVCEVHFNAHEILPGKTRKLLKKNSLPSLYVPIIKKKDAQTLTEAPKLVEKCIETEARRPLVSDGCQTPKYLSSDTPRKRKLKLDLMECRKKIKLLETDNKPGKNQIDTFHKLCDKFLTKELAEMVKAHLNKHT